MADGIQTVANERAFIDTGDLRASLAAMRVAMDLLQSTSAPETVQAAIQTLDRQLTELMHVVGSSSAQKRSGRIGPASVAHHDMLEAQTLRRILVVDDNEDAAEMLSHLLTLQGNETRTAHDGRAALVEAEAFRPHWILLDIGLPQVNGLEVCRRIRQQPWGREMNIVALTGLGREEDKQKTAAAGFDDHLVKPVDRSMLKKLLSGNELPQLT